MRKTRHIVPYIRRREQTRDTRQFTLQGRSKVVFEDPLFARFHFADGGFFGRNSDDVFQQRSADQVASADCDTPSIASSA